MPRPPSLRRAGGIIASEAQLPAAVAGVRSVVYHPRHPLARARRAGRGQGGTAPMMWLVAAMREPGRATMGRAPVSETPATASAPAREASPDAPTARGRVIRPQPVEQSNPTYGATYWALGALAASPALLCGLVFLVPDLRLPRVPRLDLNVLLGVLVLVLALANVVAHQLDYPAWSQPLATMLPVAGLFLPAAMLHGQAVTLANGDPDPVVAAPALVSWLLLALAAMLTVIWGLIVGRHAPSYRGPSPAP